MPREASPSRPTLNTVFYGRLRQGLLAPKIQGWTRHDAEIYALFFPALIALILEPVQQLIDSIFVGHLGTVELGSVGLATVLFQFVIGSFAPLLFATTPMVAGDVNKASRATAQGMWVALIAGMGLLFLFQTSVLETLISSVSSDPIVGVMAVSYLRARSWGIPAALVMMVSIGASRGHKDMQAPLIGSLVYLIVMAVMDPVFMFTAGQGVQGAGYAASVAQWSAAAAITGVLMHRGVFHAKDLLGVPHPSVALPYLRMTPSLLLNNVAAMLPMLVATSLSSGLGPTYLAAHTVLRQLSGFWGMTFLGFNATAHSMVAATLSKKRSKESAEILCRICEMAVALSMPVLITLFATRSLLPGVFTSDGSVVSEVAAVLPLLLICMPLDALGVSIEGGVLAADTRWVGTRCSWASAVSLIALGSVSMLHGGLAAIWIGLKMLNLSTLGLDIARFTQVIPPKGDKKIQ